MAKLGGNKRKQLVEEWEKSIWLFTIDDEEQKRELLHQKRALETELQNESSKCKKLESETAQLHVVTKEQDKTIAALHRVRGRRASYKSWGEYS